MKNHRYCFLTGVMLFLFAGCGNQSQQRADDSNSSVPPAVLIPATPQADQQTLRFLEAKIKADPDDFIAQNKLAAWHLQRVRETGDLASLNIALKAAKASLAALPAERNTGALTLLAQAEFTSHEFASSRDHAERLIELESDKGFPFEILGDALLELGDYERAESAFRSFEKLSSAEGLTQVAIDQRMSRLAFLRNDPKAAERRMIHALRTAVSLPVPPRETVAWCRWQLGELAFAHGDYASAERNYRDALTTYPGYYRAVASLGRARAAQGDLQGAIAQYEHAVKIIPDPSFVASLGDLYQRSNRLQDAEKQYKLFEAIAKLSVYSRLQAMFFADHDVEIQKAYSVAAKEYEVRKDIYGADALAWTAFKVGRRSEAKTAIEEALRLGTPDARMFYHAGEIAKANGETTVAIQYFKRAMAINPEFDPLQADTMKASYSDLSATAHS